MITRELDGCVIEEYFDGGETTGNLRGHSLSIYSATDKRWHQTWVDNQGGHFALTGGPDGQHFVLVNARTTDSSPHLRMRYEAITPDSLTWRWQHSDDGKTWSDRWVIHYARRKAD